MLELEHGFRVVDVHLQLEPDESRRAGDRGDPEQVERELHQAGVVRALAFAGAREEGYLKANNAVARMSVGRPFVAMARINGARDPGQGTGSRLRNIAASRTEYHTSPEDIEKYAYDDRFAGFKLHPTVDGLPDEEVLSELAERGLPVLTYGGRGFPPSVIEETLLEYDFPLVVSHFGGYPLDDELTEAAIDLLSRHDNCYLDTTFVRKRDPIERAVREHPDRVFFGSGAPASHPNVAIMEVLTLDVPEDAMKKVFSKNAARVIEALSP
ncbi:amidohydrolase family protein [Salinibaculum rarum]|uniref:amidohydrolase family protein n=1 Tax=Salinibaculum rarum TaxID=3058903 RepID=UPI00265EC386|nr:amidohydrolase family protein [Salinibaculum sp. KK48]